MEVSHGDNALLYRRTVHCALILAQVPAPPPDNYAVRAFKYAEMAKGRAFLDSLGRVLPEQADFPPELEARIRQADALKAEHDFLLLGRPPSAEPHDVSPARQAISRAAHARVQELEAEIDALWAGIRHDYPQYFDSRWPVNDAATALLFTDFYRRFTAGEPIAEALRDAQLHVRDKVAGAAHPYYWAAFVASGAVWL